MPVPRARPSRRRAARRPNEGVVSRRPTSRPALEAGPGTAPRWSPAVSTLAQSSAARVVITARHHNERMPAPYVVNGRFLQVRTTGLQRTARALLAAALDAGLDAEVVAPADVDDPLVDRRLRVPS